ncbi:MAG: hypothetical protein WCT18_00190 [Patescibacteria group bacterium]
MKKYQIATDCGHTGHAVATLHAEITLGLKKGYGGFLQEKTAVLDCLTALYCREAEAGRLFIPMVVTDSVITYAYRVADGKWHGEHEPALVLSSDKSPLYAAHISEEKWQLLVEETAHHLGEQFEQFRVYVTYSRVEVKIFQKI